MTVTTPVTADDLTVSATGGIDVSNAVFTINDGTAATDCDVFGTLRVLNAAGGVVSNTTAVITFENNSKFVWNNAAAVTIPTATWAASSSCNISNATTGNLTPTVLAQTFGNFTWNFPTASGSVVAAALTDVRGSLRVGATNLATNPFKLGNGAASTSTTFNIGGDLEVLTGYLNLMGGSGTNAFTTVNLGGNVVIDSGALLDLRNSGAGSAAFINLTNAGTTQNFTNAGDIARSGGSGVNKLVWNIASNCTLSVNSGNLVLRPNDYITGAGGLTVTANGGLAGNSTNLIASALGTVHYGGTLILSNLPAFTGGESFVLFDATNRSGSFVSINPATPGTSLTWDTSQLTVNGKLLVSTGSGGGSIKINASSFNGATFTLSGNAGAANANAAFSVVTNANFSTSHTNWNVQGTGTCDGSGNFIYSAPVSGMGLFYDVRIP